MPQWADPQKHMVVIACVIISMSFDHEITVCIFSATAEI